MMVSVDLSEDDGWIGGLIVDTQTRLVAAICIKTKMDIVEFLEQNTSGDIVLLI